MKVQTTMVQPNCGICKFKVTVEEHYFNFYFIFDKSAKEEEKERNRFEVATR